MFRTWNGRGLRWILCGRKAVKGFCSMHAVPSPSAQLVEGVADAQIKLSTRRLSTSAGLRDGIQSLESSTRASPQIVEKKVIDLRSDTLTTPCQRMREAMFTADVGDDVYGEDPTINKLERIAAELFGKESALFVPTGTMGNSCAIASHCFRGDELICGNRSHIFNYEAGSASTLFGVSMHTIPNHDDGTFSVKDAIQAIRPDDPHFARTRLICVENTHNMCGGRVLPLSFLEDMKRVCKQHNLALHMDGARIANAAAALDIPVYEILSYVDTASICLSKGLGAPVGSILVGPCEFIQKARRVRKLLGGGMRQAGIIAAAGLVALQQNIHRVFIDNDNAKLLAQNLMGIKGICVSPETVETNIVLLSLEKPLDCKQFVKILEKYGVLAGLGYDSSVVRLVTHLKINKPDIEDVSKRIHFALREVLETATHAA